MKTKSMLVPKAHRRYKCRNSFCTNHYDEIIGGDKAFGSKKTGAVCIPCLYAAQLLDTGLTLDKVDETPHVKRMFLGLLAKTGWTWDDMIFSYQRMKAAPVSERVM